MIYRFVTYFRSPPRVGSPRVVNSLGCKLLSSCNIFSKASQRAPELVLRLRANVNFKEYTYKTSTNLTLDRSSNTSVSFGKPWSRATFRSPYNTKLVGF